jgi:hypothetical protein
MGADPNPNHVISCQLAEGAVVFSDANGEAVLASLQTPKRSEA